MNSLSFYILDFIYTGLVSMRKETKIEQDRHFDEYVNFEMSIYRTLAKTEIDDKIKILAFPHPDGYDLPKEDIDYYITEANLKKNKLLVQIKYKDYYVVYDKDDANKVGIIPLIEGEGH